MIHITFIMPAVSGAMKNHIPMIDAIAEVGYRASLIVPDRPIAPLSRAKVFRYPLPERWFHKLATYLNPLWARQHFLAIKKLKPDIVHLMNGEGYPFIVLWSRWIRRELGCPFVVSVHDPEPHPGSWIAWVNYNLGQSVIRSAACVHIFSECFVSFLTQHGIPLEKIRVIPLLSDVTPFTQYKREGVEKENMVLFFGRLEAYKGLDYLVEAAHLLRNEMRFVIAGPGRLPRKLRAKILSVPELIELRNYYLDEKEVAELFMRAAVCVMPYIQSTQSSVPLIAAAFGVPVVATDTGGIASQVRKINGIVVPPRNPQALADGIRQAVGRPVIWPEEWNIQAVVRQYDDMYKTIISGLV